jgi:hypothetical protein
MDDNRYPSEKGNPFVMLYFGDRERLPYEYPLEKRGNQLVIPLRGDKEILVGEGETFSDEPLGAASCGIMEPRTYRGYIHASRDEWFG